MRRPAAESDFGQVCSIYMDERVIPFLGYDPMSKEEFKTVYAELIAGGNFFVHELEGQIAGFYKTNRYPGRAAHVAYIGSFAVNPAFQGRGLATAMPKEAIADLRTKGIKRIELIVESDNPAAIALYEKCGFEKEGHLRKFYKRASEDHYVDDYLMALLFA
ncbi:MAG: GNAT family protein [Pseudomonadota bacterium]